MRDPFKIPFINKSFDYMASDASFHYYDDGHVLVVGGCKLERNPGRMFWFSIGKFYLSIYIWFDAAGKAKFDADMAIKVAAWQAKRKARREIIFNEREKANAKSND